MSSNHHILFLSQCLPYPPHSGVTSRTFNILKQLAKEFDITLLAFSRSNHQPDENARNLSRQALEKVVTCVYPPIPVTSQFSITRRLWDHLRSVATMRAYTYYEYWSEAFHAQLRTVISKRRVDLVHIDSLDLHRWLSILPAVPTICTHHSIESQLLRLRADRIGSKILSRYIVHQANLVEKVEKDWCPRISANVMMSDLDGERLRGLAPGSHTIVVTNGVDTDYFMPEKGPPPIPGRVVFLGPLYMFPNRDAVDYLLREIWPRIRAVNRGASLHLIGPVSEADRARYNNYEGVTSLGYVADVRPHLAQACCSVVPLRVGGGTRLKILDAWAMGKAVVSTHIGCEGLKCIDGENILIRDHPHAFAEAVLEVICDAGLRSKLGENGRKAAEEFYSWDVVGRDLRKHYVKLLRRA
jgi:glycosyltransferase involved in cell wall biosynthesis